MSNGALIGLTQDLNKQQSLKDDQNTMMTMLNLKKQQESEEQMSEAAYAEQMRAISKQSEDLLQNDRLAINKKAIEFRNEMRQSLKSHGGSYSKWMKSGGISELRDYQRKVTESDEFYNYKNNKANMSKIIEAKDGGFGHLLSDKDLKALKQYELNGKGNITFNGLLNDIEIDEKAFEWGVEITPDDVLHHNNNRQMIIKNYEQDTGQVYNETTTDKDLKDYITYKGYGGIGQNTQLMIARQKRQAQASKAKQEAQQRTISGAIGAAVNDKSVLGLSLQQMLNNPGFESIQNKGSLGITDASTTAHTANRNHRLSPDWFMTDNTKKGQGWRLAGGQEVDVDSSRLVASMFEGIRTPNKDGSFTMDPTGMTDTFDAKGSSLKNGTSFWDNWKARDYQAKGTYLGYKSLNAQGEEIMITVPVDSKGKVDQDKLDELYGDEQKLKGNGSMFILMSDPKDPGNDFYMEVDANSQVAQSSLATALGESNDLSDQVKENNQREDVLNKANLSADQELRLIQQSAMTASKAIQSRPEPEAFNSGLYEMTKEQYTSGNHNRNNMVKSFYQLLGAQASDYDKGVEQGIQNKMMWSKFDQMGLNDMMLDPNVNDQAIMEKVNAYNFESNEGDLNGQKTAQVMAVIWKDLYNKLNEIK